MFLLLIILSSSPTFSEENNLIGNKNTFIKNNSGEIIIINSSRKKSDILSFFSLIKEFSLDVNSKDKLDFYSGANKETPIEWIHDGLKNTSNIEKNNYIFSVKTFLETIRKDADAEYKLKKSKKNDNNSHKMILSTDDICFGNCFIYEHYREGRVIINNNNKASHFFLERIKKPVKWTIRIFGNEHGSYNYIDMITLENNKSSLFNLGNNWRSNFEDINIKQKGKLLLDKKYVKKYDVICRKGALKMVTLMRSVIMYEINLPSKKPLWLFSISHCAGANIECSYEYIIFIEKPDEKKINAIKKVSCLN